MSDLNGKQDNLINRAEEILVSLEQTLLPLTICVNREEGMFLACVKAALAKNYEVNRVIAAQKSWVGAFTLTSSLRGLCEDIIALRYIADFPNIRDEVVNELLSQEGYRNMDSQRMFFKEYRPAQPLLNTRAMEQDIKECTDRLKGLGYNTSLNLMNKAEKTGLKALYDYLYRATSANVHFNPHTLIRMGWSDNNHSFRYSIDNLSVYYFNFNRVYGILLYSGRVCQDTDPTIFKLDPAPFFREFLPHWMEARKPLGNVT